ncbi:MAG TPA: hypothetical protein VEF33_10510, partial [Syntrophales bacterium]|nr:hypothetical protein [Syntrophales bacterium]
MSGLFAKGSSTWVKTIGVYIILILALLRFLIYPLHAAVKDRREAFADQQDTCLLKSRLLQQARQSRDSGTVQDLDKVRTALYPRETRASEIQADILATVSKYAEEKGLTILGFEMPELITGKKISEIPVMLKVTGSAKSFVKLLKSIQENKKALAVKA